MFFAFPVNLKKRFLSKSDFTNVAPIFCPYSVFTYYRQWPFLAVGVCCFIRRLVTIIERIWLFCFLLLLQLHLPCLRWCPLSWYQLVPLIVPLIGSTHWFLIFYLLLPLLLSGGFTFRVHLSCVALCRPVSPCFSE
jgi:hypothetical protein